MLFPLIHCLNHCHDQRGTTVVTVQVHLDELAIPLISALSSGKDPLAKIRNFFTTIFDEINREMTFGIQVQGDFSLLPTTRIPAIYDRTMCYEVNPAAMRVDIVKKGLISQNGELKNHIIIFLCPNNQLPMFGKADAKCGFALGFLYCPQMLLRQNIKKQLQAQIDKGYRRTCEYARTCENGEHVKYVPDLKAVRHEMNMEYEIKDKEYVGEHDLYDDVYVKKYAADS